jgi:beta-carotene 3-hydroxylase
VAAARDAADEALTMSAVLVPLVIVLATVATTEWAAVMIHRHVMHGFGWGWHRSHHEAHDDLLEENDLYAVVFAGLAVVLMAAGHWVPAMFWISIGLVVYGVLYFFVHDGLVHQRWPFRHVPRRGYLKRLYQAHKMHHAVEGRDGTVSFGFLYAPPLEKLRENLRRNGALRR